jgi:hypothetical protein
LAGAPAARRGPRPARSAVGREPARGLAAAGRGRPHIVGDARPRAAVVDDPERGRWARRAASCWWPGPGSTCPTATRRRWTPPAPATRPCSATPRAPPAPQGGRPGPRQPAGQRRGAAPGLALGSRGPAGPGPAPVPHPRPRGRPARHPAHRGVGRGERRPGTVGLPLPGVELRLAGGQEGEVRLRGPNVFVGYWGNPRATAEAFDPDGWFRTGEPRQLRRARLPAHRGA